MKPRQKAPGLTVGKLRAALALLPDAMEVVVRDVGFDSTDFCGGIVGTSVAYAHDDDDTEFLAIDCSMDNADFEDTK